MNGINVSAHDEETRRLEEASEWLMRLQEEGVPDTQIVGWVEWCEAHPENRKAFERLLPLWQAFDGRTLDIKPARRIPWAIAAGIAVAAISAALFFWRAGPERVPHLSASAQFESAPGINRPAVLPDGSTLDLGARSSVALHFGDENRRVDLGEGEAFFDVKPDRRRPFVVHAGGVQITAIGTQFNVLRAGGRTVVTVQEGLVKVGDSSPEPVFVPAGYQAVYDTMRAAKPAVRAVDAAASTAWRRGHLEYFSEPLSSIVATLNRYSATQVVIDDPALGAFNYTGTIEVASIDEWIAALPRIFPVRIDTGAGQEVRIAGTNNRL